MVSVRLDPATDRALAREAKRKGRTNAALVRTALTQWLEDQEDIRIASERLKRLAAGKSRTYTMDEVKRELGLPV
jgi:RHH-type rel operon transcriptional repressor/antitoxin RelB